MNHSADDEQRFLDRSRSVYAASLSALNQDVVSRLHAARQRAVAEADRQQSIWRARPWALPAGVVALVFVGLTSSVLFWGKSDQTDVPLAAANSNDMAIVLSNDNLDMYADMDFYRWLQAQAQAHSEQDQSGHDDNG